MKVDQFFVAYIKTIFEREVEGILQITESLKLQPITLASDNIFRSKADLETEGPQKNRHNNYKSTHPYS